MDTLFEQLEMAMKDSGMGSEVDPGAQSGLTVQMEDRCLDGLPSSQHDPRGPIPVVKKKPNRGVRTAAKSIYQGFLKAHVCKLAGEKLGPADLDKGLKALQKHIGQASARCGSGPCRQLRGRWSWPEDADMKNPHNRSKPFIKAFEKNYRMPTEMTENNLIDSFLEQLQADCDCSELSAPDFGVLLSRPGTDAGATGTRGTFNGTAQQEPQNSHLRSLAEVLFSDNTSGELSQGDQEEEAGQENLLGRFPNAPLLIGEVNSTQVRRSRTRGVPRENTAGGAAQDTPNPAGQMVEAPRACAVSGFRSTAEWSRAHLQGDALDSNLKRIVEILVKEAAPRERLRIQSLFIQLSGIAGPDSKRDFAGHILHHTDRKWNPEEQRIEHGAAPSRRLLGVDDADLDSVISWSLVHCRGNRDALHVLEHQLQRPVGPAQCILYSVGCGVIDALRGPLGNIGGSPGGGPGGGGGTDSGGNGELPPGGDRPESRSNKRRRDSREQAGNGANGTARQGQSNWELGVDDKGIPRSDSLLHTAHEPLPVKVEGDVPGVLQPETSREERGVAEDNFSSNGLGWCKGTEGGSQLPFEPGMGEDPKAALVFTRDGKLQQISTLL
ncbi:hypothetical protein KFL_002200190 [Klebsormidium nitens]|uniref:Uncharacterized protein n=1 Tax=Klebsormidium nitens TaxID=105231 RepID=A0A1Y1I2J4_KLENI|nr:hypothetical protein KFL_002200190 [Klebsormidium nitens]|eukprot:GAQ85134.1 hypothetical protein KFL_002200190 [Klebsormidium nitens]